MVMGHDVYDGDSEDAGYGGDRESGGGLMYVFADSNANFASDETMKVIDVPLCDELIAPIVYTIPLQLLSYYVAIIKGTDVDQPRNLAKSSL